MGGVGSSSARDTMPIGPAVMLVSMGNVCIRPDATSPATTLSLMIQIARAGPNVIERPKAPDTVSITLAGLLTPSEIMNRSTIGLIAAPFGG